MKILLHSDDPAHSLALNQSLAKLVQAQNIEIINSEGLDKTESNKNDIIIVKTDKIDDLTEKLPDYAARIFVFVKKNAEYEANDHHSHMEFIQYPIKLGIFIEHLSHFIQMRITNEKLKSFNFAHYTFDPTNFELTNQKNKEITQLTDKEAEILLCLYNSGKKPILRQDLLHKIWGYAQDIETHTLETHIYRLRQKIEETPSDPAILVTEEEGYILNI